MSHCLLAKHSSFSEEETLPWDGYEIYLLLLKMNFSVSRRAADRNERVPEVPRHHLENGVASEACPARGALRHPPQQRAVGLGPQFWVTKELLGSFSSWVASGLTR